MSGGNGQRGPSSPFRRQANPRTRHAKNVRRGAIARAVMENEVEVFVVVLEDEGVELDILVCRTRAGAERKVDELKAKCSENPEAWEDDDLEEGWLRCESTGGDGARIRIQKARLEA